MFGSFSTIAEGAPILSRLVQFLLESFRRRSQKFHIDLILPFIISDFAAASF
jgi:hypothetical protein